MKIALLAKGHSIHTIRWANSLAAKSHEVHLISATYHGDRLCERVFFHQLPIKPPTGYFFNARSLRHLLRTIQPDLLHSHFASGYGTLGRLSGFHPAVLSVWGSDVYEFPQKSWLHRKVLRENLRQADVVCSTSLAMAQQVRTIENIDSLMITPFGIDTDVFSPGSANGSDTSIINIGTVKTLSHKYGIDLLLQAFAKLKSMLGEADPGVADKVKLTIVGGGPDSEALREQATELGIQHLTDFVGSVPHSEVVTHLRKLDVYVALSRLASESFGVAVLEASACGLPVVVSEIGGLPEVVIPGKTGIVVPSEDSEAAAKALMKLVLDSAARRALGSAGREHVIRNYDWAQSVVIMENVYSRAVGRMKQ